MTLREVSLLSVVNYDERLVNKKLIGIDSINKLHKSVNWPEVWENLAAMLLQTKANNKSRNLDSLDKKVFLTNRSELQDNQCICFLTDV